MKLIVGYPERPTGWVEPDRVIDSGEDNEQTRDRIWCYTEICSQFISISN